MISVPAQHPTFLLGQEQFAVFTPSAVEREQRRGATENLGTHPPSRAALTLRETQVYAGPTYSEGGEV